jgi:hypothetical protein
MRLDSADITYETANLILIVFAGGSMANGRKRYLVIYITSNFVIKIPYEFAISERYIEVKRDKFTMSETVLVRKTPFIEFTMPIPLTQLSNIRIE